MADEAPRSQQSAGERTGTEWDGWGADATPEGAGAWGGAGG